MLDGLDDVAWDRLDHAYGPVVDVPGTLREVAAGNSDALSEGVGAEVLLATGSRSPRYYVPVGQKLAAAIPKGRFVRIPKAGHDGINIARPAYSLSPTSSRQSDVLTPRPG